MLQLNLGKRDAEHWEVQLLLAPFQFSAIRLSVSMNCIAFCHIVEGLRVCQTINYRLNIGNPSVLHSCASRLFLQLDRPSSSLKKLQSTGSE